MEGRKSARRGSKVMWRPGNRRCMAPDAISSAGVPLRISDSAVADVPECISVAVATCGDPTGDGSDVADATTDESSVEDHEPQPIRDGHDG